MNEVEISSSSSVHRLNILHRRRSDIFRELFLGDTYQLMIYLGVYSINLWHNHLCTKPGSMDGRVITLNKRYVLCDKSCTLKRNKNLLLL